MALEVQLEETQEIKPVRIWGARLINAQSFINDTKIPFAKHCTLIIGGNDKGKSAIDKCISVFFKAYTKEEYLALINFKANTTYIYIFLDDYYILECSINLPEKRKTPDVVFKLYHGLTFIKQWFGWSPEIVKIVNGVTMTDDLGNQYNLNFKFPATNLFIENVPDEINSMVFNNICIDEEMEARISNVTKIVENLKSIQKEYDNKIDKYNSQLENLQSMPVAPMIEVKKKVDDLGTTVINLTLLTSWLKYQYKLFVLKQCNILKTVNVFKQHNSLLRAKHKLTYKHNILQTIATYNTSLEECKLTKTDFLTKYKREILQEYYARLNLLSQVITVEDFIKQVEKQKIISEISIALGGYRDVLALKNHLFLKFQLAILQNQSQLFRAINEANVLNFYLKLTYKLKILQKVAEVQNQLKSAEILNSLLQQYKKLTYQNFKLQTLRTLQLNLQSIHDIMLVSTYLNLKPIQEIYYTKQLIALYWRRTLFENGICPTCKQPLLNHKKGESHVRHTKTK